MIILMLLKFSPDNIQKNILSSGDAYPALRQAIIELYLRPGAFMSIKDICEHFQLGRSPVRDALVRLEQEGLIERNGYFDSTGGRKAQAIQIVPDFKISIGIGIFGLGIIRLAAIKKLSLFVHYRRNQIIDFTISDAIPHL